MATASAVESLRELGNRSMRGRRIQTIVLLQGEPITVVVAWGRIIGAVSSAGEKWMVR